jgi:DNA-binding response OmpR family regulator
MKVLLVEDDDLVREMTLACLTEEGFELIEATRLNRQSAHP